MANSETTRSIRFPFKFKACSISRKRNPPYFKAKQKSLRPKRVEAPFCALVFPVSKKRLPFIALINFHPRSLISHTTSRGLIVLQNRYRCRELTFCKRVSASRDLLFGEAFVSFFVRLLESSVFQIDPLFL